MHNIPSNLAVGKCNKDDKYNCLNKNLFTSIIQPGVYARSEIIEPIQSNIGISFDQQFEPITCEKDCNGGVTFVSHDPKLVPKNIDIIRKEPDVVDLSQMFMIQDIMAMVRVIEVIMNLLPAKQDSTMMM